MTYTNRICNCCGIRKPQPQMISKEIYAESGKSKTGVSVATFIGSILGHRKSSNSILSWLFNSGQRTYKRKSKIWLCPECQHKVSKGETPDIAEIIVAIFIIIVGIIVYTQ
jgi:hypothetical protein